MLCLCGVIKMPISKARYKANQKWDKENLEQINIKVRKGRKEQIRAAADAAGESVNAFILGAIDMRMATPGDIMEYTPDERDGV